MRPITVTEFAKERQVSRARVYQWIEDGRIARLPEGGIDADDAHQRLGELLDRSKGVRRDGNVTSSAPQPQELALGAVEREGAAAPFSREDSGYWESRARREKADAAMAEMRMLQAAGGLVDAAGVEKEFMEAARAIRNAMMAIPDRVSTVLDPANPARAHKLLTDEIVKALRELTARLEQRVAADSGAAAAEEAVH